MMKTPERKVGFSKTFGHVFGGGVKNIEELFSLDLVSLAVFRVGLGVLVVADLGFRSVNLVMDYTDDGVMPRELVGRVVSEYHWSFHMIFGGWQWQALLFGVAAVLAVMLVFGYKTRLAMVFGWLLMVSLHNRNPMVLQGGDVLLRMMMFWGMFLPLSERLSIDGWKKIAKNRQCERVFSLGGFAYVTQMAMVYGFGAGLKTGEAWLVSFSAVHDALSIDHFATPLGLVLLGFVGVLPFLTQFVYWLELLAPLLLLFPFRTRMVRGGVVVVLWLTHLAFGLFLELGLFSWISIVALVPLVPGEYWTSLLGRVVGVKTKLGENAKATRIGYGSTVSGLVAFGVLVYVFWWNLSNLPRADVSVPRKLEFLGQTLRVDQAWSMFAPYPLTDDGWFVVPGQLSDGRVRDMFANRDEVVWEKPKLVSAMYWPYRRRKYMMNLWLRENAVYRGAYAQYLCREWNETVGQVEKLTQVQIFYMRQDTQMPGEAVGDAVPVDLGKFGCDRG